MQNAELTAALENIHRDLKLLKNELGFERTKGRRMRPLRRPRHDSEAEHVGLERRRRDKPKTSRANAETHFVDQERPSDVQSTVQNFAQSTVQNLIDAAIESALQHTVYDTAPPEDMSVLGAPAEQVSSWKSIEAFKTRPHQCGLEWEFDQHVGAIPAASIEAFDAEGTNMLTEWGNGSPGSPGLDHGQDVITVGATGSSGYPKWRLEGDAPMGSPGQKRWTSELVTGPVDITTEDVHKLFISVQTYIAGILKLCKQAIADLNRDENENAARAMIETINDWSGNTCIEAVQSNLGGSIDLNGGFQAVNTAVTAPAAVMWKRRIKRRSKSVSGSFSTST